MHVCVIVTDQDGRVAVTEGDHEKNGGEIPGREIEEGGNTDAIARRIVYELGFSDGTLINDGEGDYHYLGGRMVRTPAADWNIVMIPMHKFQQRALEPQTNALDPVPHYKDNRAAIKVLRRLAF
jgi:hypothetical protein